MKIYGLSGKSGTGKSYNAIELCSRLRIEAIVDDGLFIESGAIVAGTSAKKQATSIRAIRTALFEDEAQCAEVRAAIEKAAPESILILGASDRMVYIIASRLGLPEVSEHIHIEDITTRTQRERARDYREKSGTHVIPAPTLQVRKQFSGYFMDPKRSFRSNQRVEKTVVRPTYSYLGRFEISEKVITDIIAHIVDITPGAAQLILASSKADANNCLYMRAAINAEWGCKAMRVAEELQRTIIADVSRMTNFNILWVEIEIRGYR